MTQPRCLTAFERLEHRVVRRFAAGCLVAGLVASLAVSVESRPQAPAGRSEATVSSEVLSADQVAIYQAVIRNYQKDAATTLNIANVTDALGRKAIEGEPCVTGFLPDWPDKDVLHRLDATMLRIDRVAFVNPEKQRAVVSASDPRRLMMDALSTGRRPSDRELENAIKRAFENGLFSLSEIVFDKEHRHAIVAYSFYCGSTCGNGATIVFQKDGDTWKEAKRCHEWVS